MTSPDDVKTQFQVPYDAKPGGYIMVPLPSSTAASRPYPQQTQQYYGHTYQTPAYRQPERRHHHDLAKGAAMGLGAFMLGDMLF
jgi:hypothetical protein